MFVRDKYGLGCTEAGCRVRTWSKRTVAFLCVFRLVQIVSSQLVWSFKRGWWCSGETSGVGSSIFTFEEDRAYVALDMAKAIVGVFRGQTIGGPMTPPPPPYIFRYCGAVGTGTRALLEGRAVCTLHFLYLYHHTVRYRSAKGTRGGWGSKGWGFHANELLVL